MRDSMQPPPGTDLSRHGRKNRVRLGGSIAMVVIVAAIGLVWAAPTWPLRGIAKIWVVSDDLDQADAIAVLGGGLDVRPIAAADLYKRGLSHQVLVANAFMGPGRREALNLLPSDAELNREVLLKRGVPFTAIAEFGDQVSSTYEEARAILAWAKTSGAKSVIIPIDIFSTRRVRWIFNHELAPAGVRVIVRAVTPQDYSIDDWWKHENGLINFQNEVIKFIYYRIRY
ncbi:MAG: YdcF family protein [Xanthobacteraceae bacterium]